MIFRPGFEYSAGYGGQTDNLADARKIGGTETIKGVPSCLVWSSQLLCTPLMLFVAKQEYEPSVAPLDFSGKAENLIVVWNLEILATNSKIKKHCLLFRQFFLCHIYICL